MDASARPKPWLASLLSLLIPGLGHVYCGAYNRALVGYGVSFLGITLGCFLTFGTRTWYSATLVFEILWFLGLAVDAWRWAALGPSGPRPWYLRPVLLLPLAFMSNWVMAAGCPVPLLHGIRYRVFQGVSSSMEPTLKHGDWTMVDQWSYRHRKPQRQDVIVFEAPEEPEAYWTKRCVAIEGDEVEIRNRVTFVNGLPQANRRPAETWSNTHLLPEYFGPVTLPPGTVFCLGDNPDNSYDSRFWGPLRKEAIVGKVLYRCW